ncbi:MAG: GyrI-like domain-containing protein [Thermoleophilia bacterium]|nr:GyrI-like domain-containing protein [Thermoleophilia bacterium]
MAISYQHLAPIIVASMRHRGAHIPEATNATWEELILWASPRKLLGRRVDLRGVGLLWDDPRQWPADQRRYDVGVPVNPVDSELIEAPAFLTLTLPGTYGVIRYTGPYSEIPKVVEQALTIHLPLTGHELVAAPILELYRNSPADFAESDLITDICIPVTKL